MKILTSVLTVLQLGIINNREVNLSNPVRVILKRRNFAVIDCTKSVIYKYLRLLNAQVVENLSILFNAQSFGFGPTASIAWLTPHFMLHQFKEISFAGSGFTLDLQRRLPYTKLHDLTNSTEEDIKTVIEKYDVIFTAMDIKCATLALAQNKKVVFYDAVSWFWPHTDEWSSWEKIITHPNALYLAQNFFGISESLSTYIESSNIKIVPPLISKTSSLPKKRSEKLVFMNFGGLQNPLIDAEKLILYSKTLITIVKKTLPERFELKVAVSKLIADAISMPEVSTYSPSEIMEMIASSSFVLCTPGLGNIYETAATNTPVIFLPPTNETQGMQLELLKDANMVDADCDWGRFSEPLSYFKTPVKDLINGIAKKISKLEDPTVTQDLTTLMEENIKKMIQLESNSAKGLIEKFGTDGASAIVKHVQQWMMQNMQNLKSSSNGEGKETL